MITSIEKSILIDFEKSQQFEWLETNGLGGYSSSSIINLNTRKYHGLFVAAQHPPVGRVMMVNKMEEEIIFNNEIFEISSNQYPGTISPKGYQYISLFEKLIFPRWTYELPNGVKLLKEVSAINGRNITIVSYELENSPGEITINLRPFLSVRDHHTERQNKIGFNESAFYFQDLTLIGNPVINAPEIQIKCSEANFYEEKLWFHNVEYLRELDRGHSFREELFSPGKFEIKLKEGEAFHVIISTENIQNEDPLKLLQSEFNRRVDLFDNFKIQDVPLQQLILAADQFIVKRDQNLKTIIAGYPWFSDWGRDTMISLPGLCLTTKRYKDAEKILKAFATHIDKGMIPNRFPDQNETPEYNTVDATLWYFVALYQYCEATKDDKLVKKTLWKKLKSIIEWHEKGTRYHIKEDTDGLLFAGESGVQLTWMDAKIDNWVVTPRIGKPVEIQALWYNALKIMEYFSETSEEQKYYATKAKITLKNFENKFWSENDGYLFDYIDNLTQNNDLRPNQVFALSLPFPLIKAKSEKGKKILEKIESQLLTNIGLLSLSPQNHQYVGTYEGNQLKRDSSYHQGTGWTWLIGPYANAILSQDYKKGIKKLTKIFEKANSHLNEAGIGTVSEIFDGNYPNTAKGCFAQAWGVAEWLRIYNILLNSN